MTWSELRPRKSFGIRPQYLALEGGAGSGKTAAMLALLDTWNTLTGREIVRTREPGGTIYAESVRQKIFEAKANCAPGLEIVRMFYDARCSTIEEVVIPNLKDGRHVITDRYAASTFAYEGGGERVDMSSIYDIHRRTVGNFGPDLTYYLRLNNPEDGIRRKTGHADLEPFDYETTDYHLRIQKVYDDLHEENHDPRLINPVFGYWILIDADKSPENVADQIRNRTIEYLSLRATILPANSI